MNKTIAQWIDAYKNGEFTLTKEDKFVKNGVFKKVCDAGWYDWFCSDEHCLNVLKTLAPKIIALAESNLIDKNKTYLSFENKCPMVGPTYEMFAIFNIETDEQLWGFSNFKKGCYGKDFSGWSFGGVVDGVWKGEIGRGSWRDVKKYFNVA